MEAVLKETHGITLDMAIFCGTFSTSLFHCYIEYYQEKEYLDGFFIISPMTEHCPLEILYSLHC